MREAIGGTWLTQLVIIFMLLFVAFLALSLNYTKAFKMKNEVLTIIEKYEGLTDKENGSIQIINNYLKNNNYRVTKRCPEGSYGVRSLDSATLTEVTKENKNNYYYCVTKMSKSVMANGENYKEEGQVYYKVNLFLYFNLPILGDIFKFDVNGSTGNIIHPGDTLKIIKKEEKK